MSLSTTIKSIQDIMRKDVGVDGDAQRIGRFDELAPGQPPRLIAQREAVGSPNRMRPRDRVYGLIAPVTQPVIFVERRPVEKRQNGRRHPTCLRQRRLADTRVRMWDSILRFAANINDTNAEMDLYQGASRPR